MFSTSFKIAFGYVLLIVLMFVSIGYVYRQMNLLISSTDMEKNVVMRRRLTNDIISTLYKAEITGQNLRLGSVGEYPVYRNTMQEAVVLIDSLQKVMSSELQIARLDTVKTLLREKEQNVLTILEILEDTSINELYHTQIRQMIASQDSAIGNQVKKHIVTRQNTYTIKHKKKGFFKRLAEVFVPGKPDSTEVHRVVEEIINDSIDQAYIPDDSVTQIINTIQHNVHEGQLKKQRDLSRYANKMRMAGNALSQRVNQLLDSIEQDETQRNMNKLSAEYVIRKQAARTIAIIAVLAIVLMLMFCFIVLKDISRSNHYRKELEKSKLYAENLLTAREKLMLTITHDIKAPTGSIIGFIELMLRLVKDKRQLFYLQNMKSSAQHLLLLITSLLDYHRLEAGKMDLHPVAFNPAELFDDIYTSFLPLAAKKGLKLDYIKSDSTSTNIKSDPFRLRQIIDNLISNALKFTAEGSITLKTYIQQNMLIIRVTDTGCGMSEEEQNKIFKEFTRLNNAQGQEGFGLGLSITKKLVELLDGNITLNSEEGKGSEFCISIPVVAADSELPSQPADAIAPIDKQVRILMIDDDRIQLRLTIAMLQNIFEKSNSRHQLIIDSCLTPEELLGHIEKSSYDVILTDIQMPSMSGFDLLKKIKGTDNQHAQDTPVIAITARSDMDEAYFRNAGFAGCLHKPFNQSELQHILRVIFHKEVNESVQPQPETTTSSGEFNFAALTAFSEDDKDAAKEILNVFVCETEKNIDRIKAALQKSDAATICAVAHKMLPSFTLIEDKATLPALQWLENNKQNAVFNHETEMEAHAVVENATYTLDAAQEYISELN